MVVMSSSGKEKKQAFSWSGEIPVHKLAGMPAIPERHNRTLILTQNATNV
jgi:hypothetical protein